MTKISKSGIAPLQQIKAEHVTRIIDALAGDTPNTQIEISGSITASYFIGDGSQLTNLPSPSGDFISSSIFNAFTSSYYQNSSSFNNRINDITISQIILTTTGSISTDTLSGSINQSGKNIIIDNGSNNIDYTLNTGSVNPFVCSFLKHGTGAITFVTGSGSSLIQVDGTNVLNGALGSTATLSRVNNTYYLRISNV